MADFQSLKQEFDAQEVVIVAASVDPLPKAADTARSLRLTFPVCGEVDAREISRRTGAFFDPLKGHLHATGFLVRPDKTLEIACYSTGPIGRLAPRDVLALVKFYQGKGSNKTP